MSDTVVSESQRLKNIAESVSRLRAAPVLSPKKAATASVKRSKVASGKTEADIAEFCSHHLALFQESKNCDDFVTALIMSQTTWATP